ncbi:FBD-associated F-box protein At5g60610-like [Rhododendron vialii]|uniref:FBD-associated F-box protein At5g60610-like n=1 Tax=Rhododendron vialii TaxID=182163 RepID=UPI00265E5402|nr:FBD-associated F-box protein At5g60610-like [Rhododendron vialii]
MGEERRREWIVQIHLQLKSSPYYVINHKYAHSYEVEKANSYYSSSRRVAAVYPSHLPKRAKRELLGGVDWISQLPREILGAILSRLTLEEAGRTSVLSRSWRHLWAFLTTKLNFGAWKSRDEGVNIGSPWYARRVNRALKLHLGAFVLDKFIIRFYPEEESRAAYYGDLHSWVNFAFQKGVKRLELDLASDRSRLYRWYAFPSVEKLRSRTSNTRLQPFGFCHLITLCLKCVNITGKVLEHFLGNCPLLEQLQVMSSDHLTNLKVAGPSLKLKWLGISRCENLKDLEISAVNLASLSFTYFGQASRVILRNVPVLSELCIEGDYIESVIHQPTDHLSYIRQLERLKLKRLFTGFGRYIAFPPPYPELRCLKQLELELPKIHGENLIFYSPLYQSTFPCNDHSEVLSAMPNDDRYARVAPEYHHRCLQVVELVGFSGHPDEVEFLSYWLVIAVSLGKLVINPRAPSVVAMGLTYEDTKIRAARECAWQLQRKVPAKVKLVVL